MSKEIIIGDIHGNYELVKHLESEFKGVKKLFLGDILDSPFYSIRNQISSLQLILEMIDAGEADCLFGNHEMSYLEPKKLLSSGYEADTAAAFAPFASEVRKKFKPFVYDGRHQILFSHAGVTNLLWDYKKLDFENIERTLFKWFHAENFDSPFYWIGPARVEPGTLSDMVGGLQWCDWNFEFIPVPDLSQVVGHTNATTINDVQGIRERRKSYNIDCLNRTYEVLEYNNKTGELDVLKLDFINRKKGGL